MIIHLKIINIAMRNDTKLIFEWMKNSKTIAVFIKKKLHFENKKI